MVDPTKIAISIPLLLKQEFPAKQTDNQRNSRTYQMDHACMWCGKRPNLLQLSPSRLQFHLRMNETLSLEVLSCRRLSLGWFKLFRALLGWRLEQWSTYFRLFYWITSQLDCGIRCIIWTSRNSFHFSTLSRAKSCRPVVPALLWLDLSARRHIL
jgi:hypothetical protein